MIQQNFLSTKRFDVAFSRLPNLEFFVQNVTLPGVNSGFVPMANPFATINKAADKLVYDDLVITVVMDENLEVFKEIYNWMSGLTKPKSFSQYADIANSANGLYSDASVFVLNSKGNVNLEFKYVDVFPINLSGIQFNTTDADMTVATCDITFKYTYFDIVNP